MIYIDAEQGTHAWLRARAGVVTASIIRDAISRTAKGERTQVALDIAGALAIERISREPYTDFKFETNAMRRGRGYEGQARATYARNNGVLVRELGLVLTDDRRYGYSTDGEVLSSIGKPLDGGIEIKVPTNPSKIISMWRTGDTEEYDHQMQFGMWMMNWKWVDFVMYTPELWRCHHDGLYVKRVERDDNFIDEMWPQLESFSQLVDHQEAALRRGQGNDVVRTYH